MNNVPVIKIGIVAVSRDCFPESLAVNRRKAVIAEYEKKFGRKASTSVLSALLRVKFTLSRHLKTSEGWL